MINATPTSQRELLQQLKEENETLRHRIEGYQHFVTALDSLYAAAITFDDDSALMPFLRDTMNKVLTLLNAPAGSLLLLDDETHELVFVIVHGPLSERLTGHRIPADEGVAGWVVQHCKATLVRDVRTDPRFYDMIDEDFRYQTQSIAAAPIVGNQKVYGLVEVLNQPSHTPFSEHELALLKVLCRAMGEALADMERMVPESAGMD